MKRRDFLKYLTVLPFASFLYPLPFSAEQKKILFMDTVLAGFQYYSGRKIWSRINLNDSLRILREPENAYDSRAIEVYWRDEKLGYIPRDENSMLSQIMDRGTAVKARVISLDKSDDPWERVGLRVEMEV